MHNLQIHLETPNSQTNTNDLNLVSIKTIDEGVEKFIDIIKENCMLSSDFSHFESGLIYLGTSPIGRISYNGKVWDLFDKDLRDWKGHDEVKPENFSNWLDGFSITIYDI